MKKTLFTFMALLFVVCETVHAQSRSVKLKAPHAPVLDCSPLRNGTFKAVQLGETTIIKRSGSTELQYVGNSKVPLAYTIKWKSDCTYTLTPTLATLKQHPEIKKNTVLTVETTEKNTNSYSQVVSPNYAKGKVNVEIYKLN